MNSNLKKKVKEYTCKYDAITNDGEMCTVFVYGELTETNYIDGVVVNRVKMTRKGHIISETLDNIATFSNLNATHAPVKELNIGWAICDGRDEFDIEKGKHIARKRFSKSPLSTQNGNFLTNDMCNAIIENEAKYIGTHLDHFFTKKK